MSVGAVTLVVIGGVGGFCYGRVGFASFGSTKSELASMYYVLGGIAVLVVFAAVLRFCVAMRSAASRCVVPRCSAMRRVAS